MKDNRSKIINRIMVGLVVLGFVIVAGAVLHSVLLTEYEGTLEESLSFTLPAGYEEQTDQGNDVDSKNYVRETDATKETINIYYAGMGGDSYIVDKTVRIDDDTEVGIGWIDWDHENSNSLEFTINHDGEYYLMEYRCREKDKTNYYDSCSKAQEEEMMSFIGTFDYHRPDGSDLNVLQRLYHNYGTAGCILLALTILFFIGFPVAIGIGSMIGGKGKTESDEKAISSKDLHESMNRERMAKGEENIPAINTVQGASTNTLARRDHSWNSVPDFFIKMFRGK